jgi:TonB family protein
MKSALKLFIVMLLGVGAAAAQGPAAGAGEPAESARLNADVIRLYREGKFDEALPLARRVLEVREKALGSDDMAVASALNNLSAIYARKGKAGEAEQLLRRSLAIAEKRVGAESDFAADVVAQLGRLRLEGRDYKEAGPLLQRALGVKEKLHGADNPSVVPVLFHLTDLYFLRGEPEQAYAFLGRAISVLGRQSPRKDAAAAARLKNYYCPLMAQRDASATELAGRVGKAIRRLEEPERAAEFEKEEKAREARGERDARGVAGGVLNGRVVSKPAPEYPLLAKEQRLGGVVVVGLVVDESGKVVEAEALCGHPVLARASVEAARKARFTPTLLGGSPVKVSGVITYNFVLQ